MNTYPWRETKLMKKLSMGFDLIGINERTTCVLDVYNKKGNVCSRVTIFSRLSPNTTIIIY